MGAEGVFSGEAGPLLLEVSRHLHAGAVGDRPALRRYVLVCAAGLVAVLALAGPLHGLVVPAARGGRPVSTALADAAGDFIDAQERVVEGYSVVPEATNIDVSGLGGADEADNTTTVVRLRQDRNDYLGSHYIADDVIRAVFGALDEETDAMTDSYDVTHAVKDVLRRGGTVRPSASDLGLPPARLLRKPLHDSFWDSQPWACHTYESGQNDTWCQAVGIERGIEYKFTRGDGTCKACWCCKRNAQRRIAPRDAKVLHLRLRRHEPPLETPAQSCYGMAAGLDGVELAGHGDALFTISYSSRVECSAACGQNSKCGSFTACSDGSMCYFFGKVEFANAEAPEVVHVGHGCHHYVEVPCDSKVLMLGPPVTLSYSGQASFDSNLYSGAGAIAGAFLGDLEVTNQVRQIAGQGRHVAPADVAGGTAEALHVRVHQDPSIANWLTDGSLPWQGSSWACYNYPRDRPSAWYDDQCKHVGVKDGMEYKFAKGDGTCGLCWCCRRPAHKQNVLGFPAPKVDIYFGDTRRQSGVFAVPGVPGRFFTNLGAGLHWHNGYAAKIDMFEPMLEYWARQEPTKLMIVMDSDVGFGGCSDAELLHRYEKLVAASGGATVVTGADPWQNPPVPGMTGQTLKFVPRQQAVLRAFGMDIHAPNEFVWGGPPVKPHDYVFLNSGFLMGPAKDLHDMFQCAKDKGWRFDDPRSPGPYWDDQRGLSLCFVQHPDKVTIDYTGSIVATLYGTSGNLFEVRDQKLHNRMANVTQCFLHTDCSGCAAPWMWTDWLTWLTRSFHAVVDGP